MTTEGEARTANSGFKKLANQWLIVLQNRQLLNPAKR